MRFRKIQWSSWWWLGELREVPRCLLWRWLRHHWSCVHFLYLVSSSTNVCIFHITCLDTFWTDLVPWPNLVTDGGNIKDYFTSLINMQIFIRLFPKWIISLSQYGSQHYSKTKEEIWKGSCKVKSAIQMTSPVLISIMILFTRICNWSGVHQGPKAKSSLLYFSPSNFSSIIYWICLIFLSLLVHFLPYPSLSHYFLSTCHHI